MAEMTLDRDGHPWRAYSNGRVLCAASRPFHDPYSEEDGRCDCLEVEGETIAVFHWTPQGMRPGRSRGGLLSAAQLDQPRHSEVGSYVRARKGEKTPDAKFYEAIKQVLSAGELRVAEAVDRVGKIMEEDLNEIDLARLKSGEIRWRNTCRWARNHLLQIGVLDKDAPHGIWRLA